MNALLSDKAISIERMIDHKGGTMSTESGRARLEIDVQTLHRLLQNNQMCVSELRCLDKHSKLLLRKLCLNVCCAAGSRP